MFRTYFELKNFGQTSFTETGMKKRVTCVTNVKYLSIEHVLEDVYSMKNGV